MLRSLLGVKAEAHHLLANTTLCFPSCTLKRFQTKTELAVTRSFSSSILCLNNMLINSLWKIVLVLFSHRNEVSGSKFSCSGTLHLRAIKPNMTPLAISPKKHKKSAKICNSFSCFSSVHFLSH